MIEEHDLMVLRRELSEHGLEAGDVGVAVAVYTDGSLEVEFVNAAGHPLRVLRLGPDVVRLLEGPWNLY